MPAAPARARTHRIADAFIALQAAGLLYLVIQRVWDARHP